ncbi:kinesin-like protein KIN-14R [Salvia hispanica]|uniref:kinesin-like protein KIN-14R n=1 Tax=Salvia hispanica TaxID=49212 RepID=UPI0020096E17|nr:kinesin-like protein KIN-14R [Salvia hispanica]
MEQNDDFQLFNDNQEIRNSSTGFDLGEAQNSTQDMEEDEKEESVADLMVWDSCARLIPNGFTVSYPTDEIMLFVNAGSMTSLKSDSGVEFTADNFYEGGDAFQTEDFISEGGDCSFVYQSARLGNFSYSFENFPTGDYFIDLHFSEIINVNGPKGMRVFNVFMQDEKILSEFDIFSIVGFNKPLQVIGARAAVKDDGILRLRFEGVFGNPIVSGICVRRAPKSSVPQPTHEYFTCSNCSTQIEYPSPQKKAIRTKSVAKYEKDIQELKDTLKQKTDECYQSWMSWSATNEQLQKVRMDLDNKTFQTYSLDKTLEEQATKLRDLASKYEHDKESWTKAISDLEQKVKIMKQEHSELSREAHECADSIPDLNKMVFAVQALVEQCEDLKFKYNDEQMKRRKLHNQLQETKGNIRVFCRCRPLSKSEVVAGCASVMDFDAANDGDLGIAANGSNKKSFKFDRVYTPKDDQVDVFADAAPMVVSVLDGYNVCIFAYGQTGTGKTFTMEGTEENRGVNYRTLEELFKIANERTETNTYNISVSVLEVYNEQIRDLLAIETSKKLEIKQASEGSHHIPGIVEAKVENIQQVWNVLQAGSSARAVGSNNVNEHSSRSHCMLCIMVRSKNLITGECTKSKLWLVDLAGSERLAKTDVQGDRLKEAQNINRSLSALGDVISALANKSSHIPYRNSKLTHLLQDSLGGDSKTLMFVQISPSDKDLSETLSSLNFATRVRGVELGPARKQVDTTELQKMKTMLEKARLECKSKDESLKRLEENLHNLESKAKGKDQFYKTQLEKLKELEGQVELKSSLQCQSEKQVSHLSEKLKGKEESCSRLQQKVVELENKLKEKDENHSTTYQIKVNDLEKKLREQMQQSESNSQTLEHKVKELERKLTEREENAECLSLRQTIKELEDKLREKEQQPVKEEMTNETEHRILRSLSLANRRGSHGSAMAKENDNLHEVRRKRLSRNSEVGVTPPVSDHHAKENDNLHEVRRKRLSRNSEVENNGAVPPPVSDHRVYKSRRSDPPKPAAAGVSRVTKPSIAVQRPVARVKTTRDAAVQGIKEKDSKKRMWTR